MDIAQIGALLGVAIAMGIVIPLLVRRQRKTVEQAFGMLKERGPMTLDEIAAATGTNFVMKGYLMQALDAMALEGRLTKTLPPKGHPVLRMARDTKYGLPAGASQAA